MNTDSSVKKNRLLKSFGFALTGIKEAVRCERNLRIHLFFSVIVICMGIWLSISVYEWLIIVLAIAGMLSLEMLNSAIERVVDLVTTDFHPLAKAAKDMAAGAVLIFAIMSVIIGLIIFLPKIIVLFH
ncbi:diacylglycerol kinase family protein [Bacillus sp. FJAT-49705]|uniref:Diacylglycerol kinase family protein n=1 Tax=Cytobacillus citreus TaxID=2833586 RepID=A0ABS5NU47_9BACI|nr:diacylglycerol kinase family protein [Cytobacillus citreus]MBS4191338.1 diacylglycerol kinase family protein [Cytobacillus citreus]